jgi:hypothetical protein
LSLRRLAIAASSSPKSLLFSCSTGTGMVCISQVHNRPSGVRPGVP